MSRTPPRAGSPSPWGTVQYVYPYAEGVISVGTAGHGGIWLSDERLAQMPANEQSTDGWYEEDCEAVFPLRRFRMSYACKAKPRGRRWTGISPEWPKDRRTVSQTLR